MICLRCKEAKAANNYVTGAVIKRLREEKGMTQAQLAEKIFVSSKTVSKWETGQGFPDISLLESLAKAIDISVIELLNGEDIRNKNKTSNIAKGKFYICPVCGNVIYANGEAVVSCCGITLPPAQPEVGDEEHIIEIETVEDEYYVYLNHPMTKGHFISFIAAVSDCEINIIKMYPEGNAETRFRKNRVRYFYAYCNRHGLFRVKI